MGRRNDKKIGFFMAILPLFIMIMVMLVTVVKLEQGPHMPLIVGTTVAALVAWRAGYSWKEIEEMMYKGIRLAFLPLSSLCSLALRLVPGWAAVLLLP